MLKKSRYIRYFNKHFLEPVEKATEVRKSPAYAYVDLC